MKSRTINVKTETDLRDAARRSQDLDQLDLFVSGSIGIAEQVFFPDSPCVVTLHGNSLSRLKWTKKFGGWNKQFHAENMLQFNNSHTILLGLRFDGFDGQGSVVKCHGLRGIMVDRCDFIRCGAVQHANHVDPPLGSYDSVYNQCIAAHGLEKGTIQILRCRFTRCARNNWPWSHCVYVSAGSVIIFDNKFVHCGSPLGVGGTIAGSSNVVIGNTFMRPARTQDQRGRLRYPHLQYLQAHEYFAFVDNVISGEWRDMWMGLPETGMHIIDHNRYPDARIVGGFAIDNGNGSVYTQQQWQEMGFDEHSAMPVKRRLSRTARKQVRA